MKAKYSELERYCKNIEVELLSSNAKSSSEQQIVVRSSKLISENQMGFLKEKNKELEERVNKLLKMNTQLK